MVGCKDIFAACPWMVELRRAFPADLRSALLRAKKHLAPADTSGLEGVLGQGSEVPSTGTSLFLMTAQTSRAGAQAEKADVESAGRIRLSRSPNAKYKYLLSNGAQTMDKASEYYRRTANQTDSTLVREVARGREFMCESMRIPSTPYAPSGKGLAPPMIRPEGFVQTLGVLRTLSRMVKSCGASRVAGPTCV